MYAFAPFPSLNLRCAGEAFVRNALYGLLPMAWVDPLVVELSLHVKIRQPARPQDVEG